MGGWRWASSAHLPHDTPCGSEPCRICHLVNLLPPCICKITPAGAKKNCRSSFSCCPALAPGDLKGQGEGACVGEDEVGRVPGVGRGGVALDLEKPGATRIYSYPAGPRDGHPFRTLFSFPRQCLLADICGYCTNQFHKSCSS